MHQLIFWSFIIYTEVVLVQQAFPVMQKASNNIRASVCSMYVAWLSFQSVVFTVMEISISSTLQM